jgi:hypothetical protein
MIQAIPSISLFFVGGSAPHIPRRAVAGTNFGDPGERQVLGSPFMAGRPDVVRRTPYVVRGTDSETYNMGVMTYKFPSSKGN